MTNISRITLALGMLLICSAGVLAQQPFTYQGMLRSSGLPANGNHDFQFSLWTAATGGSQVGSTLTKSNVNVVNGLFSVELDFGNVWEGSDRYLQIAVRVSGVGSYAVLSPRVPVNRAPYSQTAYMALTAPWSGLWGIPPASGDVSGTYPSLSVVGLQGRSVADAVPGAGQVLKWDGTAWVPSADLTDQLWQESGSSIYYNSGNVGIGTASPSARLHARGSPGNRTTVIITGEGGQYRNPAEWPPGWGGGLATWDILCSGVSVSGSIVSGSLGIGISPGYRLHVIGNAVTTLARFINSSTDADGFGIQIETSGRRGYGVFAIAHSTSGRGVVGLADATSGQTFGVFGETSSPNGFGVFSWGRFGASGTKSFQIDHPLNPETQYLNHFSAEGPEPYNLYCGNVSTDAQGYAVVQLPPYFEAINRDFRYQLTVIDSSDDFVLAKVVREIQNNRFIIRTSKPFVKVSWEVKAIRNDRWVRQYGFQTEQVKPRELQGKYVHPELYGQPKELGIHYHPEQAQTDTTVRRTENR